MSLTLGSLVATPSGLVPVEDLDVGDLVFTRGAGPLAIRQSARRELTRKDLADIPRICPVLFAQGALGEGLPEQDILVSPNHRFLLNAPLAHDLYGVREVLMAARHLTFLDGVTRETPERVEYVHLLFDWHEIALSDGCWTECFHPADSSTRSLGDAQRGELLTLFPALANAPRGKQRRSHLRPVDEAVLLLE